MGEIQKNELDPATELLNEFQDLLQKVAEDVSRDAVAPEIDRLRQSWTSEILEFKVAFKEAQDAIHRICTTVEGGFKAADQIDDKVKLIAGKLEDFNKLTKTFVDESDACNTNIASAIENLNVIVRQINDEVVSIKTAKNELIERLNSVAGKLDENQQQIKAAAAALNETRSRLEYNQALQHDQVTKLIKKATHLNLSFVKKISKENSTSTEQLKHQAEGLRRSIGKTEVSIETTAQIINKLRKPIAFGLTPRHILTAIFFMQLIAIVALLIPFFLP